MAGPMLKPNRDFPFDVEIDKYTNCVRVSLEGYTQAIMRDQWETALAEPAMMDQLIGNFMRQFDAARHRRHEQASSAMKSMITVGPMMSVGSRQEPSQYIPTGKPGLNKKLLLCEE